jgi:hypothetical protein
MCPVCDLVGACKELLLGSISGARNYFGFGLKFRFRYEFRFSSNFGRNVGFIMQPKTKA